MNVININKYVLIVFKTLFSILIKPIKILLVSFIEIQNKNSDLFDIRLS